MNKEKFMSSIIMLTHYQFTLSTKNNSLIEDQEKFHSNTCECTQYLLQQSDQLDQTSDLIWLRQMFQGDFESPYKFKSEVCPTWV